MQKINIIIKRLFLESDAKNGRNYLFQIKEDVTIPKNLRKKLKQLKNLINQQNDQQTQNPKIHQNYVEIEKDIFFYQLLSLQTICQVKIINRKFLVDQHQLPCQEDQQQLNKNFVEQNNQYYKLDQSIKNPNYQHYQHSKLLNHTKNKEQLKRIDCEECNNLVVNAYFKEEKLIDVYHKQSKQESIDYNQLQSNISDQAARSNYSNNQIPYSEQKADNQVESESTDIEQTNQFDYLINNSITYIEKISEQEQIVSIDKFISTEQNNFFNSSENKIIIQSIKDMNEDFYKMNNLNPSLFADLEDENMDGKNHFQGNQNRHFSLEEESKIRKQLILKKYNLGRYLTKGSFGQVHLGQKLNQSDGEYIECVFKIIRPRDEDDIQKIKEEVNILRKLEKNVNTLQILDYLTIMEDIHIIVIERCQQNLFEKINQIREDKNKKFTYFELLQIIFDLLDGLVLLKAYQILHLDIKPANILINKEGVHIISDYGESIIKKDQKLIRIKGFTQFYAPKEQLEYDLSKIDHWSDTYSLGKTFQQILQTYKIKNNLYETQNKNKIDEFEFIQNVVNDHMVQDDHNNRYDCIQIHHILFKSILEIKNFHFLKIYSSKIIQILNLYPYDTNKNIQYYSKIQIYYNWLLLLIEQTNYRDRYDLVEIANSYQRLGDCFVLQRNFNEGLEFLEESLKIRKMIYHTNHLDISRSLQNLAVCFFSLSKHKKALIYQIEAHQTRKDLFKGVNNEIALTSNNLGFRYQNYGQLHKAKIFYEKAIKIAVSIYKQDHDDVSIFANSLALLLQNLGAYDEALKYFKYSHDIRLKIFKGVHPRIALSLQNLGNCYNFIGNYENALQYFKDSLAMRKILYPNDHQDIATSMNYIGECYVNLGDFQVALQYQKQSLEIRQKIAKNESSTHNNVATSLTSVGVCNQKIGQLDLALQYLLESLYMRKNIFKRDHLHVCLSLNKVGECYLELKKFDLALQHLKQSVNMAKKVLPSNHPHIAKFLMSVGICYKELNLQYKSLFCFIQSYENKQKYKILRSQEEACKK